MKDKYHPWARIIVVSFNSGDDLQTCVDHLADQTDRDFEVVIVDNQSTDGCASALTLPDERFKLIFAPENLGFAGGSNLGAKDSKSEWIFTLNPDAWVEKDWLKKCKLAAEKNPDFAMLSPLLVKTNNPNIIDGCGDVLSVFGLSWRGGYLQDRQNAPSSYCRVFSPCGACAGYKTDVFNKVGGFDDDFFCYVEDVDLGLRLNRIGEKCLFVPDAVVRHKGAATLGERHPIVLYHSNKNIVLMIGKNFPLINLVISLPLFLVSVVWIMLRHNRSGGSHEIIKGLSVGLLALPAILLRRFVNRFRSGSRPLTLYTPMEWSRKNLRKREICELPSGRVAHIHS